MSAQDFSSRIAALTDPASGRVTVECECRFAERELTPGLLAMIRSHIRFLMERWGCLGEIDSPEPRWQQPYLDDELRAGQGYWIIAGRGTLAEIEADARPTGI